MVKWRRSVRLDAHVERRARADVASGRASSLSSWINDAGRAHIEREDQAFFSELLAGTWGELEEHEVRAALRQLEAAERRVAKTEARAASLRFVAAHRVLDVPVAWQRSGRWRRFGRPRGLGRSFVPYRRRESHRILPLVCTVAVILLLSVGFGTVEALTVLKPSRGAAGTGGVAQGSARTAVTRATSSRHVLTLAPWTGLAPADGPRRSTATETLTDRLSSSR